MEMVFQTRKKSLMVPIQIMVVTTMVLVFPYQEVQVGIQQTVTAMA